MRKPEKKPKCRHSDIEANAIADQAYDDGWDACIDAYEQWEKECGRWLHVKEGGGLYVCNACGAGVFTSQKRLQKVCHGCGRSMMC